MMLIHDSFGPNLSRVIVSIDACSFWLGETVARVRSQRRLEKNERTREDLFKAAMSVVGDVGYTAASIAKIAEIAGVSTGTFYLHFISKGELYEQLLPWANTKLAEKLPLRFQPNETYLAFEERIIRGFFNHIKKDRGFARVMLEAEVAAPVAWTIYSAEREKAYMEVLHSAWDSGEFPAFTRDEMEKICAFLLGLRKTLVWRHGEKSASPQKDIDTYLRFVRGALMQGRAASSDESASFKPNGLKRKTRTGAIVEMD
jgi:AcrR family transcriptional regulator